MDTIRDRAQVVNDQIMDQRSEAMNRQMLVLSVVVAIFLPFGLLTGFWGSTWAAFPARIMPMPSGSSAPGWC